jgi:hypothetical protein
MLGLRLMAGVALALLAPACGSGSTTRFAEGDQVRERLLAAADAAAEANDGEARQVEAVKTTRGIAADVTGHSNQAQDEEVWVVQVSGDAYTCKFCSGPPGAKTPTGRYLTLVLRASDFEGTGSGIGPNGSDLSRFGDVEVLRSDG